MYAIASGGGASAANTVLWAGTLERYGASQINNRFRARYQTPMDGGAWAGWVAVKIAAEAALRAHSVKAGAILSYLETPSTTFDGHKGWPLSFRSWDHQLRQPLYAVAAGRVVAELPDVGRNADQSMREELDKFGDPAGSAGCGVKR
jgi:ABC transporter substrate binding protein (PQQ-dependent alcohol dehydrogenase system)